MHFNPVTNQLVTCSSKDFGFWASEMKQVHKYPVESNITSCAWTNDGYNVILGFANGEIVIYNRVRVYL